jgi:hypothetical protein
MEFRGCVWLPILATVLAGPLLGQGSVSTVYSPLSTDFQSCVVNNTPALYAPALYPYPDGSLGMITMGTCLNRCDAGMGDSLFRWKRAPNGSWSSTFGGLSPSQSSQTLDGQTIPAGALAPFKQTISVTPQTPNPCVSRSQLTTYEGAFGNPATIALNNKLYMAYEKGNGDWWNGEIWWAVSSDWGRTWSTYSAPILYGLYHRGHAASGSCAEGFAGISMTTSTDAGGTWINIYGTYHHFVNERRGATLDNAVSSLHYRFRYDPNHPFGFALPKQLYYNGCFINHSGKFVWGYDSGAPYQPSDPKLETKLVDAPWSKVYAGRTRFGTSSVAKDSNNIYYMLVDEWRQDGDPFFYVTSCDAVHWSSVKTIDTAAISSSYPGKVLLQNALWHGTLSGQTSMWGFATLGEYCSSNVYDGARILPVKITFSTPQTCPPASTVCSQ